MREVEAKWFMDSLAQFDASDISPCINVGCGDVAIEFVQRELFSPLNKMGVEIINFDISEGENIDISGDIFDPDTQAKLKVINPKMIICSNMVEHLPKDMLHNFVDALSDILETNGIAVVSAPYSFPFHADPIDTYYRPSPDELSDLFNKFKLKKSEIIESDTFWDDLKLFKPEDWWRYIRRLLKPFRKRHKWKAAAHKLFWLNRKYLHTVVIFQKS